MTAAALGRSAAFAVLFLSAVFAGRLTVIDNTSLSMVWPAAGVAVVWFAAQRGAGTLWWDVVALASITWGVNVATGASGMQATLFVIANLVQVGVFLGCLSRWAPHLWGAGGTQRLTTLGDLWRLLAAAAVSTLCGAAIGPTAVWLSTAHYSWETTAVWLTRNTVSIVLIGAVGLGVGSSISRRRRRGDPGWPRDVGRAVRGWLVSPKAVELLAVIVCSVVAYGLTFGLLAELRIAFPLIVITVWVALRFDSTVVVLHALAMGTVAVLLTLDGYGPFAQVTPPPARALVVQLFVGVVAMVGLAVALGRDERNVLLRKIRQAQQEAAERAQLFATVVDSMAEGLTVVDGDHRFLLRNPAAEQLLGGVGGAGARVPSSTAYGLFHPDGRPMTDAEQPYLRALAGEEVRHVDVVVRNASSPAGRTLNVNALPFATPRGTAAVVVFSDVTADRRHRDELTSFAGVVAHDLLNPLAAVEGWTQVLGEQLAGKKHDPTLAKEGLFRIHRASVRMRQLISDLLAYATARDGLLRPTTVNLHTVVEEIVAAWDDPPHVGPGLRPRVVYGRLHAVRADPALLRQLLDNVIGNAVKYAPPAAVPEITVDSVQNEGMVTVTVADRGVGVPEGQHEAIFGAFSRAAGGGVPGTGLGLAICRRIVERHGGNIWAEDNPGGGTRICFSLPRAGGRLPAHVSGTDRGAAAPSEHRSR